MQSSQPEETLWRDRVHDTVEVTVIGKTSAPFEAGGPPVSTCAHLCPSLPVSLCELTQSAMVIFLPI